jgi:hypothetical protein
MPRASRTRSEGNNWGTLVHDPCRGRATRRPGEGASAVRGRRLSGPLRRRSSGRRPGSSRSCSPNTRSASARDGDRPKRVPPPHDHLRRRMPSLRIAVDLKVELFRNAIKIWTMIAIHEIDALSLAVPYCHAVVPDRELPHLLVRSRSGERCGSQIARHLNELPRHAARTGEPAQSADGDRTGRDWAGPGGDSASTRKNCAQACQASHPPRESTSSPADCPRP